MPETLMLINPSKRPSKRKAPRKTAKRRKTRRHVTVQALANPAPRRRSRARRAVAAVGAKARRVVRRMRRNPSPRASNLKSLIMPAIEGALGSLAVNTAINFLPLPEKLKQGVGLHAARLGGAVAIGLLAGRFLGQGRARNMAQGAMTVALHDLAVSVAGPMMPQLRLAGDEFIVNQYISDYEVPSLPLNGFVNPALGAPADMMNGDDFNVGQYISGMADEVGNQF